MTEVGLVLGAGGVVGQAYHAGVLSALYESTGWDPRSADIIVGTSAGSITGTMLRLGVDAPDLAAMATGAPLSEHGSKLIERILPDSSDLPVPAPISWLRPWRPPSPALLSRIARRPWSFRPDVVAMTMLPAGKIDLSGRAASLHRFVGDRWPEDLWICAARRNDGARVVFGRPGSPRAPLAAAVLASCAIPAYFAPVAIGGVEYFDGGVHSPNSADVLRGRPPRGGAGHFAHVGGQVPVQEGRCAGEVVGPPPSRAGGAAPRGRRLHGDPDRTGPASHRVDGTPAHGRGPGGQGGGVGLSGDGPPDRQGAFRPTPGPGNRLHHLLTQPRAMEPGRPR